MVLIQMFVCSFLLVVELYSWILLCNPSPLPFPFSVIVTLRTMFILGLGEEFVCVVSEYRSERSLFLEAYKFFIKE